MTALSLRFLLPTLLLACVAGVQAGTRSTIVDDSETSKINYSPQGWNQGNQCAGCAAQPDKNRARGGTWHDGTESADRLDQVWFTFTFIGTSVEVRYIAIDLIGPWTTNTNATYSMDGIQRGVTERKSTNQTDYLYDQTLLKLDGLLDVQHTLRVDIQQPGVLLFDYLIYGEETVDVITSTSQSSSSPTSSPSPSSSSTLASDVIGTNIGAVIGGVLSGVFVLVAASTFWYCLWRRRQREQARLEPAPATTQNPPLYHTYPPAKAVRQTQSIRSRVAHSGAAPPTSSQHTLPIYHNVHSRPGLSSDVLFGASHITLGTSQGPSTSESASHPPVQPQPGNFHSSTARNQIIPPPMSEPAEQGLASRRYSSQTMPPPYSPYPGWQEEGTPLLLER